MFYLGTSIAVRYASLFFGITGAYGVAPALSTWVPNNSAHHYRKATAIVMAFVMTNSGGIASTWLFPASEGPAFNRAALVNLVAACVLCEYCLFSRVFLIIVLKWKIF